MRRLLPLLLLLAAGCRTKAAFDLPIPPDPQEALATPSAEALARYRAADDYSRAHDGLAFVVYEGDAIVYETYAEGFSASTPHHLFSGTKTFACVLQAAAREDGLFTLDEPVAKHLQSFLNDPARGRVTVRQLLDFTSGLAPAWWRLTVDGLVVTEEQRVVDKYAEAAALPLDHEPGARYVYGSSHLFAFGALLQAKLGEERVDAYLQRRVLGPLGLRTAGWIHDPAGNLALPYGAFTTAREWGKLGRLLRDDGRWQGRPLLPASYLQDCLRGSKANPGYGLGVWLNGPVAPALVEELPPALREGGPTGLLLPGGPADLFAAGGHEGQRLYVLPSRGLVVVRLGESGRSFTDAALLRLLLPPDEG